MTLIQEFKFWVDVIEQTAIPVDGERLTPGEQGALSQTCSRTCRVLAQTANYAAYQMEKV